MSHSRCRAIVGGLLVAVVAGGVPAFGAEDTTLEATQRLFKRTVQAANDAVLSSNPDAGMVITALRSSRDQELMPLFAKLRQSKVPDNQLFAAVAMGVLAKDGKYVDVPLLLASKDQALIGSAIATLMDADILSVEQLQMILKDAPDGSHKAMAGGELARKKALPSLAPLLELLKHENPVIRYYAATTVMAYGNAGEQEQALAVLKGLSGKHVPRELPVQALMLVRAQKESITGMAPWAMSIAEDETADQGLRYTAVACALALKAPQAAKSLAGMIDKQRETIQQVKLGLISLEHAKALSPGMLEPLVKSKSGLARTIGTLAQKGAEGGDTTAGLLTLIKEGHPIVLDWALAYTDRVDGERKLAIRNAVVNQSTIVDNLRERDYQRAAVAAQKILDDEPGKDGAGRKTIVNLLASDNRAVVEATIAGVYRSKAPDQAELIKPIWAGLTKATTTEQAANFAALILAREGKEEALSWLPSMVAGGTVQEPGFKALAGWYYAKLKKQQVELLRYALGE